MNETESLYDDNVLLLSRLSELVKADMLRYPRILDAEEEADES